MQPRRAESMSVKRLCEVGRIKARPITPLWIGGYNASTYSSVFDLVESIRPYEVKGVLRWMLRLLAFSAIYEKYVDRALASKKALEFVESIFGKSSDRLGKSSTYIIRIEEPEGGVIPRKLEIRFRENTEKLAIVENWPKQLYEILRIYRILQSCTSTISIKGQYPGIMISLCVRDKDIYSNDKLKGILIPLPFIDIHLASRGDNNPIENIGKEEVFRYLFHIFDRIICDLEDHISNKIEYSRDLFEKVVKNVEKRSKICYLGDHVLRYQLELSSPDMRCFKLAAIGDPRTKLQMLGKDRPSVIAERVFMIPPTIDITIGVYRRGEDIKIGDRIISMDKISVLDEIVIRSLELALLLKGIGKATNRGYGSFEILYSTRKDENLKIIDSPDIIVNEIEYIKKLISSIIAEEGKEGSSSHGGSIYIGFINGHYRILDLAKLEANDLPDAMSMISHMVLGKFYNNVPKHCLIALGLPRGRLGDRIFCSRKKLHRLPSLIRFRFVKCEQNIYCILALSFYPITEYKHQCRERNKEHNLDLNICIDKLMRNIYSFTCSWRCIS